ncbi:MAG TPA: type VI secretion system baseplate subunit TssG [Longimicrobium sp.]
MASESGTEAAGVAGDLFAEPQHFDFFQAVRVLEAARPLAARVGEGREPAAEAVRFRATPALSFASSDVAGVAPGADGGPPEMTVAFLGLAGAGGPLPHSFSEWVMHQARAGDRGPRDFLDLFHHRLVSLLYRARSRNRPSLARVAADETPPGRWIHSLVGLGTPGLRREGTALPHRALLGYAALFATETRSGMGLECVLASHFGVRARVEPFTGGWIAIEPDDWTRIGITGSNRALGHDAVLGRRAWDAASGFELVRAEPQQPEDRQDHDPRAQRRADVEARQRPHQGAEQEGKEEREGDRKKELPREPQRVQEREHRQDRDPGRAELRAHDGIRGPLQVGAGGARVDRRGLRGRIDIGGEDRVVVALVHLDSAGRERSVRQVHASRRRFAARAIVPSWRGSLDGR